MTKTLGQRVLTRFFCAICSEDIPGEFTRLAPLGKNGAMVHVCDACDQERAREKRGPERGYEGAGRSAGSLGGEIDAAMRREVGDAGYERMLERERQQGISYTTTIKGGQVVQRPQSQLAKINAKLLAKKQAQAFAIEGRRLERTGAKERNDGAIQRSATRDSQARKVPVKSKLLPYRVTWIGFACRVWFKAKGDDGEGVYLETQFKAPALAGIVAMGIARGIGARKTSEAIRSTVPNTCEWKRSL